MTTEPLFRDDPCLTEVTARVLAHTAEGGIVPGRTIFYPTGGGLPGDSGGIGWSCNRLRTATTVKGEECAIVLAPALPPVGAEIT